MTDLDRILPLWRELESSGAEYVLATVVTVEGPSYRKPGARMLLAPDGRRAGTVSGGCLEAEVTRRAWWLTAQGPVVERYSTAEDDGERPYGSGCGGVVFILLERRETAGPLLAALEPAFSQRAPLAIATLLEGPRIGQRAFATPDSPALPGAPSLRLFFEGDPRTRAASLDTQSAGPLGPPVEGPAVPPSNASPQDSGLLPGSPDPELQEMATLALAHCASMEGILSIGGLPTRAWADYRRARPGLWIFGAGDDAKPLVRLARELGWFVAVADGRSHLATRERFPEADLVRVLRPAEPSATDAAVSGVNATDAAVVMAHSFEQDGRVLAALLALDSRPAYLGVLGPQRRTRELLAEAARLLDLPSANEIVERGLEQVHAPMGLDLGAEAPASIALSILAEIQQALTGSTGAPLRTARGAKAAHR
jgi:xanthine/CO dehydrogenase XdhC/CoxF family maturation factor